MLTGVLVLAGALAAEQHRRIREAVAMALQRLGRSSMDELLKEMDIWARGNWLEKRAAAAALCEPRLLDKRGHAERIIEILDSITATVEEAAERTGDDFNAFRKGLSYCWSVAVAALPEEGKRAMERWFGGDDKDVRWIMRENLRKKRLARMDPAWVERWTRQLSGT